MPSPERIQSAFQSSVFTRTRQEGDDSNIAALPDVSLEFLVELCQVLSIKKVFEFGSGRSTKALLGIGCQVTSLEDSEHWMQETQKTLTAVERSRHKTMVKPLTRQFVGSFPVLGWELDQAMQSSIEQAELILIDSPYYTPFRESVLWTSLNVSNQAIVVLDDVRIPTIQHFCDRLVKANSSIQHRRVKVGHTFDVFYRNGKESLQLNQSIVDIIKGWRRYFQGTGDWIKE